MTLKSPFEIGSRLLPALWVGDGWLSLERGGWTEDRRICYRWYVDIPAGEFSGSDLRTGVGGIGDSYQEVFVSLLSFLSAAAESRAYRERTGREGENEDLFPPKVVEWAHQNSDEIGILECEIEETADLIQE